MKKTLPKSRQVIHANVLEQQRKELDVKTKQPIQMADVIYTNFYKTH